MRLPLWPILLASCATTAHGPAVVIEREVAHVPSGLQDCPVAPPAVPAPKAPRTLQSVVEWVALVEERRVESARIAALCRQRLLAVNELVGHSTRTTEQ